VLASTIVRSNLAILALSNGDGCGQRAPTDKVFDVTDQMPSWERRLRAPQIPPWTLLGSSAVWPRDTTHRALVMANLSGRVEAYVYGPGDEPAALQQVTDRPQGTLAASMSPNGDAVLWFDDSGGDEVGRWVRQPVDGGDALVLGANLDPGFMAGVAPLADGGAVIVYLGDVGMTVVHASADGDGRVVGTSADAGELVGTDIAETQAIIAVAREGDWQHLGVRILRLADGVVTHERVEPGRGLPPWRSTPVAPHASS